MTVEPLGESGARVVELNRVDADNGSLVVGQWADQVPFEIARVFMVFDVPEGDVRGTHAHRECEQFLICPSGSLRARVDDGRSTAEVLLDRPEKGLYMPPLTWGAQFDYAPGSVLLVLASHRYDRADYIEDYDEFLAESAAARGW